MKIPKEAQELSNKASEYINNKEFEKALKYLNKALEIEPNYAEAMSKLGYIHYRLDYKEMSKEEVFDISKKALDLNPKSPIVWRCMGTAYSNKKEYDKAIACYQKAVEIDPNDVSAWNNMGNDYSNKKEYDKAIEYYEKAVGIDPNHVYTWYNMGGVYGYKKEYDKAIKCYEKAVDIDPNNISTWYNMGSAYINKKEYDKAIECYEKVIELDPNHVGVWNNMGVVYGYKKEYDKAIVCYERVVEIDPNYIIAWYNMGNDYDDKKEYDKAIECYERVVDIDPNYVNAWNSMGVVYSNKKEYDKAIVYYQKAADIDLKYINAWNNMGLAYSNKKEHDKAIKCYEKALNIDPNYEKAWNNMGGVYKDKKEYDKAIKCYEKAVDIDPNYVEVWNKMGGVYKDKKEYDKAIKCYEKAVDIDPNYVHAWNDMGNAYDDKKEYDKAIECYEKAVDIDPNYVKAWNNMGIVYSNKKEYDKAIECYKVSKKPLELINFKSAQIPLIEAIVVQSLENQLEKQFEISVGQNRVIGISLYDFGLTSLPESIGNLTSLQRVDLSSNKLVTLPESFGNHSSLKVLVLSSNHLKVLPKSIGNLKSLEKLELSSNQLEILPESIGNLSTLKELLLFSNRLKTLPKSIGNLYSLKFLFLNYNQLTQLPESMGNLKSLEELRLGSNKISTLPESLGNLESLEELILNNNKISTLPKSLGNLKSLRTLALEENKINTIPESIRNLSSLKELYIDKRPDIEFWKNKKLIFQLDDFVYFTWQKVADGEIDLNSPYFREHYRVYQTREFDNDEFWYLMKFYFLASSMEEDEYLYDIDKAYNIPPNIPPNGLKIRCICGRELERKWNLRCSLVDRQPDDDRFYLLSIDSYYLIISEKCSDCESTICIYRNYPSTHMNFPHPLCIFWSGDSIKAPEMLEFWEQLINSKRYFLENHLEDVTDLYLDDIARFQLFLKNIKIYSYKDKLSRLKSPIDTSELLSEIYNDLSYKNGELAEVDEELSREKFISKVIMPLWNEESNFKGIPLSKLEFLILKELENKVGCKLTTAREYFYNLFKEHTTKNYLLCPDRIGLMDDQSFSVIIKKGHIIELNLQYLLTPLSNLPSSIGWLFSLRKFNLRGAGLDVIPESFEYLCELEELDLWWNTALKDLPQALLKLKNLKKLIVNKKSLSYPEFKRIIRKLEHKGVQVEKWEINKYDPF
ncbi:MAG: tetratricopeptide repeat protein [Promethearchaeota archaeon]